jgi:UPF0755 protein
LNSQATLVEIELTKGSNVKTHLKQLQSKHVLNALQSWLFLAYIRLQGAQTTIQAGEYRFPLNITPKALLEKWVKGDVILYAVTVPEGVTLTTFRQILCDHPKIKQDTLPVLDLSQEGLYYPDTYYFSANTSAAVILKKSRKTMQKKLEKAWLERDRDIVLNTPYEALILASIIEKETLSDLERPKISGVFQRRLAQKMRLQADPTVIYGMQASYKGNITKEDLRTPTPYNTYTNYGLPPTPIALPGIQSILAALHPDKSKDLYFVAKGDGSHHFSATLQEHNEAVKKYQKEK